MAVAVLAGEVIGILVVDGLGIVVFALAYVVAAVVADVVAAVVVVVVGLFPAVVDPVVVESVVGADVAAVALRYLSSSGNRSFSGWLSHFSISLSFLLLSVATLSSFFSS